MKKIILPALFIVSLFIFEACTHDPIQPMEDEVPTCTPPDTVIYGLAADVRPLLLSNGCMSCHNTAASAGSGGGIDLETYTTLKTVADNGRLLCSIEHGNGCTPMPFGTGTKIPDSDIALIETWINACALDN